MEALMLKWKNPEWNLNYQLYFGLGALLLIAAAPLPYTYYIFMRNVTFIAAAVLAYHNFNTINKTNAWPWIFLFIAILFNPMIPVYMQKYLWIIIDILIGSLFLLLAYKNKNV